MKRLNEVAAKGGLKEYTTFSRLWEYPWIWFRLEALKGKELHVLDIGSEMSPFPWFLASQGFHVTVSDRTANYWQVWQNASQRLRVPFQKRILDALNLDLRTSIVDIYLSVSVIEHVSDKTKAITEAARVLRPGGLLVMTFDVCEPDMGMTFPEWNGLALTMREFDDLLKNSPFFESGLSELPWNTDDILEYLAWHRTTAPHHNYVTGAVIVHRNDRPFVESLWKDHLRTFRGKLCTTSSVALSKAAWLIKSLNLIQSVIRKGVSLLTSPQVALLFGEPFFWLVGCRGREQESCLSKVKRVLVVRLDEIGDVVMTTPFLRELRRNLPNAWITLVVKPAIYNLVELCPYVNEVLTYDWNTHGRLGKLRRHGRALRLAWKHLWRGRFDLAILPRWDADYYHGTFLVYFSGAPWRLGYSENVIARTKQLNSGYNSLFTHVLEDKTLKHEVEHNLDVIRFLGGEIHDGRLELWVSQEDEAFAEATLKDQDIRPGELVIGFGPSSGNSPFKQWPASNFTELGCWLHAQYGARVIILGGPGEEWLGWEIKHQVGSPVINMVGKTTLRQAVALLKRCHIYVGNDTAPMHMAAASNIPTVALFGSSCHHRFAPWGEHNAVLWLGLPCSPCFQEHHPDRCGHCIFDQPHCILDITIEQVKQAVSQLISSVDVSGKL